MIIRMGEIKQKNVKNGEYINIYYIWMKSFIYNRR